MIPQTDSPVRFSATRRAERPSSFASILAATARRPRTASALALLAGLLLAGCGGGDGVERIAVHPVRGRVTFGGQPLANAQVAFHPRNPTDQRVRVAQGTTDAEGKFQLTTYDSNDGAAAGEFVVTVQRFDVIDDGGSLKPGPNVLSPKLALPATSDITLRVAEGPNELQPIEVRR